MNDKYAKEIAKELRLIRIELQKSNNSNHGDVAELAKDMSEHIQRQERAGDRVTIK